MVTEGVLENVRGEFAVLVRFDASDLFGEVEDRLESGRPHMIAALRTGEALLDDARSVVPDLELRVEIADVRGGGPGEPPLDVLQVFETTLKALEYWVVMVTVGGQVKRLVDWLTDKFGSHLEISDGAAIVLAARHLAEEEDLVDLEWLFVHPMRTPAIWDYSAGYLVGFRDEASLYLVGVEPAGQTTRIGDAMALGRLAERWTTKEMSVEEEEEEGVG